MKLTGKALTDFKKWYMNNNQYNNYSLAYPAYKEDLDLGLSFWSMPESMQWGVYVDFFDSKEIAINIEQYPEEINGESSYQWHINAKLNAAESESDYPNRAEARTAAIEKANDLYNSK